MEYKKAPNPAKKDMDESVEAEHILACLSSSPTNASIIRTAAKMADAFQGKFTALFVETPELTAMSVENKRRLERNMQLAESLGAEIETVYGEDIAFQIAEFARLFDVSKIVLGRSGAARRSLFAKPALTEKITQLSPDLEIFIIPDANTPPYRQRKGRSNDRNPAFSPKNLIRSLFILASSTLVASAFHLLGFSEANIITVYILGVLITAMITSRQIYSLASSVIGVLLFNYLFTTPRFTFSAYGDGYPVTFLIMFTAAFLTGSLTMRIKRQARQSARTAYRMKILFEANRLISGEKDSCGILSVTCSQLRKLLQRDILFYRVEADGQPAPPLYFPIHDNAGQECDFEMRAPDHDVSHEDEKIDPAYLSPREQEAVHWVIENKKRAGTSTERFSDASCLYLAVRTNQMLYGVVGIAMNEIALDAFEDSIVLSILGECALAMENGRIAREREETALLAKNEQLRADLLRSISHDLRTPLTSISGNAGILLSNEESISSEKRRRLYEDIYEDSLWLINLVENLLSVTRIENGTMKLRLHTELLDEIVDEAVRHAKRGSSSHPITVKPADSFFLVNVDARLIVQVMINLIDNAVKYTPPGSDIVIEMKEKDGMAAVSVSDNGDGIPDEKKERIFDMFYTADTKVADSRRSLGLGLALCRSVINAHGGTISISDAMPKGAVFTFTLPMKEVPVHE